MDNVDMKDVLVEVYQTTKKLTGIDPSKPGNTKELLVDDNAFQIYVTGLAESIESKKDRNAFKILAENSRINLLENSMFQINPYETLTLPILRVFYPKLVAKEIVTVAPMDKPESVKAFIKASFTKYNDTTKYDAPSINNDISQGVAFGTPVSASITVPSTAYDVLATAGLTKDDAHLERDFTITAVSADGTAWTDVSIAPAVEGHFSASVDLGTPGTDVISGMVNYLNGTVDISSTTGVVTLIRYEVTTSLEENKINPKVKIEVDKVRLYAKDRQIGADWSINLEQDMKALFDVSMQSEIVNILGQQIALDIDREIINALFVANTKLNPANHTLTFSNNPPSGYTWGKKYWHENIITELNTLSARVYNDTRMGQANAIFCNPIDAAILEDLQTFKYTGSSEVNGDLGYSSATVAGGKWKVLTSSVIQEGSMGVIYKSVEDLRSVYIYSPYIPAILHPYPLGNKPSLTILSRYASSLVRPAGIAQLNIT